MRDGTGLIESKRSGALLSAAALGAVLWPIRQNWRRDKRDGFPLSYYPMFSPERRERVRLTYIIGLGSNGERRLIPYSYIGTGGLNQVRRQLNRVLRLGGAEAVCADVARRVAARAEERLAGVVTVQLVRGEYNVNDFFRGERQPLRERVHASRRVVRES